jgi:hypothetical protein
VKIQLAFNGGLPEIDVHIGDHELRLMVDTGARPALGLSDLSLPGITVGDDTSFGNAIGQRFSARRFRAAKVRIGSWSLEDVGGVEHVFREDFAPPNRCGLVGRELFAGHTYEFDYDAATLTLDPPLEGASIGYEPTTDGYVVAIEVDGRPLRALIDTGSTHSLIKIDAGPQRVSRTLLRIGEIEIPDFVFIDVPLKGPSADVILGANFFAARKVHFGADRLYSTSR